MQTHTHTLFNTWSSLFSHADIDHGLILEFQRIKVLLGNSNMIRGGWIAVVERPKSVQSVKTKVKLGHYHRLWISTGQSCRKWNRLISLFQSAELVWLMEVTEASFGQHKYENIGTIRSIIKGNGLLRRIGKSFLIRYFKKKLVWVTCQGFCRKIRTFFKQQQWFSVPAIKNSETGVSPHRFWFNGSTVEPRH